MKRILFLCTGNSCRSQMAEGWARHFHGQRKPELRFFSAGTKKHGLDPLAVRVMAEVGVDISQQRSKCLSELDRQDFDVVFTLCAHADAHCPVFPGRTRLHHVAFDDPPQLARQEDSEEAALSHYRRVRDEIGNFVRHIERYLDEAG